MATSDSAIVFKVEAILVDAKLLKNSDQLARMDLLKLVDDLYQALEPPINVVRPRRYCSSVFCR